MIVRTTALLSLLAAAMVPVAASAQDTNEGSTDDILVSGKRQLTKEETLDVVSRVAKPVDGQLARFHDPVCPNVTGFDTPYAAMVADRIKRDAEAIGAKAGAEGCDPNVFVVIVDDGPAFVRELARTHPGAVAGLSERELAELTDGKGAARAWSATGLSNSMGGGARRPAPNTGGPAAKGDYSNSNIDFGDVNVMRVYETSNINPSVQQVVGFSWVVIETQATLGKSLRQIADYAALRSLAMVKPAALDGTEDTILGLFEPDTRNAPSQLTDFDLAYLTNLYRAPPRRWAWSQANYIAGAIAEGTEEERP